MVFNADRPQLFRIYGANNNRITDIEFNGERPNYSLYANRHEQSDYSIADKPIEQLSDEGEVLSQDC